MHGIAILSAHSNINKNKLSAHSNINKNKKS
jgi:hypothetical protein